MRKIFLIGFLLMCGYAFSQSQKVNAILYDTITSTERDALTIEGSRVGFLYNETTGQFEVNPKNSGWVSLASNIGALTSSDIGSTVQGYNANTDTDSTDDVTLTGNQNIDGTKTFYDHIVVNSNGDSDASTYSGIFQFLASGDVTSAASPSGQGGTYFNNDGSFRIQKAGSGANFGIDFSALTATQDLVVTDTDITWNSTSLLSGGGSGDVSAASNFGTDNVLIRADGTSKGVQSTGITINDSDSVSGMVLDADNNTVSNIGAAEVDLTDNYDWTGVHKFFTTAVTFADTAGGDIISSFRITESDGSTQKAAFGYSSGASVLGTYISNNQSAEMLRLLDAGGLITDADFEAASVSITSGTSDDILLADGTTTSLAGIGPLTSTDIGASDKTLTSSDVGKFNFTDDSIELTLDNSLGVSDVMTFMPTDIDSIITVVPDTGVDIIGNGTEPIDGAFQIDSLNIGSVKKLASNLYAVYGYVKPYTPSVSLVIDELDDANTIVYLDAREFSASSNGASVSPTDQTSNGTTVTSTAITKGEDSDSDPTFSFNGTTSRMSLGNNFNFQTGVAQSIGIFISADGFGTGARFSKRDDASGGSNDHFAVYNSYYYMGNNEGNPSFSATTNVLITLAKDTSDNWYIYENGTQRATGSWTNETSAVDLLIGAQVNGGGFNEYSTGEIEVFFITDDFISNTEAGTIATAISTR